MSLDESVVDKLDYLSSVGCDQDVIESCKEFWTEQGYEDVESITDDLEDEEGSDIIQHLQNDYSWNEQQSHDFYHKLRQAFDIDPKPQRETKLSEKKPTEPSHIETKEQIEPINAAIGRYYEYIKEAYTNQFSIFCSENGFNDIKEELESIESCNLLEFDPDFPFQGPLEIAAEDYKQQFLFDLISVCRQDPDIRFDTKRPHFLLPSVLHHHQLSPHGTHLLYDLTEKEYLETKAMYKEQCRAIYNSGMDMDAGFVYICGVGRKHRFNYLQDLIVAYSHDRKKQLLKTKPLKVDKWCNTHPHFQPLKKFRIQIPWKLDEDSKAGETKAFDVAKCAVQSFEKRVVRRMPLGPSQMKVIDDSLEITIRYFEAFVSFIGHYLKVAVNEEHFDGATPIVPFQVDFNIVHGAPKCMDKMVSNEVDDDDKDDEDDETDDYTENKKQNKGYVDCVGDIQAKLEKNDLKYVMSSIQSDEADYADYVWRPRFDDLYKQLLKEYNLEKEGGKRGRVKKYLNYKRMVVFIDRRSWKLKKKEKKDDIWMFEPPPNCRDIPKDYVPEWFINASKTCLLPNMEYGDGKLAEAAIVKPDGDDTDLVNANICSSSHCKGAVSTFSFIVRAEDDIQVYMYWNGMMLPFAIDDIEIVLPKIFNMKWNNNEKDMVGNNQSDNERFLRNRDEELEESDILGCIERMKKQLPALWHQSYKVGQ